MKEFKAMIYTKIGGKPVLVYIYANDFLQAKKLIELRPEFKSFAKLPT